MAEGRLSGDSPPLYGYTSDGEEVTGRLHTVHRPLRSRSSSLISRRNRTTPYPSLPDLRRNLANLNTSDDPASSVSLDWDGSTISLLDATTRTRLWSNTAHLDVPTPSPGIVLGTDDLVLGLDTVAGSNNTTVVNPTMEEQASSAAPSEDLNVAGGENGDPDPPHPQAMWTDRITLAMMDIDDLILPYRGKNVRPAVATEIRTNAATFGGLLRQGYPHCNPELQQRITDYRRQLAEVCVGLEELCFQADREAAREIASSLSRSPSARSSPIPRDPDPPTAVDFDQRSVTFLMNLISDDNLPDVGQGIDVDVDTLKELYDVKVPEVLHTIKDLREAAGKYASRHECDAALLREAQEQSQHAYEWTRQVTSRYRSMQLHLDGSIPAREPTFTPFNPSGDVSIYEFFTQYEEWARGYISDSAKAHLLFTKYLPSSLTENYEELQAQRKDYEAMKRWMIDQFGMLKGVADGQLKVIKNLKTPRTDDLTGYAQYLRSIHRCVHNLYKLEIQKGVRVPQLQEHLEGNTFLMQLAEVLPSKIQQEWSKFLAKRGVTTWKVEGREYFNKILEILQENFLALEIQARLPSKDTAPKQPKAKAHHAHHDSDEDVTPGIKRLTAAVDSKPKPKQQTGKGPTKAPDQSKFTRWTCLVKGHEKHDLGECRQFFEATPQKRRASCRWQGCWTCLSKTGGDCKKGHCSRLQKIPVILICQGCAVADRKGLPPLHVLMCGIKDHAKPDPKAIGEALEKWVPKFQVARLSGPVAVSFVSTHASAIGKPPTSRSSPPSPTNSGRDVSFDTHTGESSLISSQDSIIRPSKEESFYIMQQLCIGGESVLTFYDSGSNTHLVEGELAEKIGFTVLDDRCVPIGVVGGGRIWSEYGQYSCILGPDCDNRFHELECQGLTRISAAFPEFQLGSAVSDAMQTFQDGRRLFYPKKIGGDRVKLLLGIKSMSLAPKLHCTLPNGLGVFISALIDVYGSNIAFGGTHEVFTKGYAQAGISAGHVQVLFTEVARAYMHAPYTMVASKCEDHGPRKDDTVSLITEDMWDESVEGWLADKGQPIPVCYQTPACSQKAPNMCCYTDSVHKALIPLSKLKGLIDEDDIPAVTDFRCDKCANCPSCKLSSRAKTQSLQESFEQEVIEKSVTVDLAENKVRVELPFIRQPVEFLSKRHQAADNKRQALQIYRSQCFKPPEVKDQIRAAQADLVKKGFMVPLRSLPPEKQALIETASFRHYYPWRAISKPGSVSTPVRLVVDPSCTGLNIILAKGQNMLARIPDVLVRLRTHRFAWTTDVSKLYNMLHLEDSALPFSLFLYDPALSATADPEVWVMLRAWYGVSSTGNQSGVALERLAELNREKFPLAADPLLHDRYVDDIASGADSLEDRERQIKQTESCLKEGGFSLKFVATSGNPPPDDSSTDGKTVGCLGLSWDTTQDTLSPSVGSMNLQKKIRGIKAAPDRNVTTREGLTAALKDGLITRVHVLSRIAEFFDPTGWWEPLRLQMKIAFQEMNSLDWKDSVPDHLHADWVEYFLALEKAKSWTLPRCIIPLTASPDWKIRLICMADAAEGAGGTAIYGGVELPDGSFSCSLLLAKSRLMKHSVPRNELDAILLMADAALNVRSALGERVCDVFFYTDSVVAMCWVLNTRKRLRMFVHNRVQSIRQAICQVTDGQESIPLFHVDGTSNIADLLTKPKKLSTIRMDADSDWQNGLDWMRLPTSQLPNHQYTTPPTTESEDMVIEETFKDIELHTIAVESRDALQDLSEVQHCLSSVFSSHNRQESKQHVSWLTTNFDFVYLGWAKAYSRLKTVCSAMYRLLHRRHALLSVQKTGCPVCNSNLPLAVEQLALKAITRAASFETEQAVGKVKLAKTCRQQDGVWFSSQRLEKEGLIDIADLDVTPFYDGLSIKKVLPVILVKSSLFHAFLIHIHFKEFPHAGVEATLARIKQTFYPVGEARRAIAMIKKACSKCRLMLKQVVGLELANVHPMRTVLAPPFYAVQMDLAMGFKAKPTKDSRKSFNANALVMVCLLTSATSIHVVDGLTTQSVVMAIERHASRYGMPGHIFVDSGTQLEKLRDTHFSLRDVSGQESFGRRFTVTVSTPKAHEQQGRVEAKIKIVRKMLQTFSDTTVEVNTLLGWETVFARIADHIDNLPIARGSSRAPTDLGWDIITPNRLKLGRNNFRQLEGNVILSNAPQTMLDRNKLLQEKWYEIFVQRIHLLVPQALPSNSRSLQSGDVVLFVFQDGGFPKMWVWKLGVITQQISRSTFEIRYSNQAGGPTKLIQRDARHISLIYGIDEISPTSAQFFGDRSQSAATFSSPPSLPNMWNTRIT